ncbi:MAG: hypothetical protein WCL23_01530 [Candidatus Moraniibacteriota bacterium]
MIRSKSFRVVLAVSLVILAVAFAPSLVRAAGVVPCGGPTEAPCTLCHFFIGIKNIVDYFFAVMMFLGLSIITAMGVLYIVSAGNEGLITTAKKGLWTTLSGIAIVLFAWLIVNLIIYWLMPAKTDFGVGASFSIAHGFQMNCDTTSSAGTATGTGVGTTTQNGVGTVSNEAGSTTVTGTGTTFKSTLKVGDTITINGQSVTVASIESDTSLTTSTALTNANTNVPYTYTSAGSGGTGTCTNGTCATNASIVNAIKNNTFGVASNVIMAIIQGGEGCNKSVSSDGKGSCGYGQLLPANRTACGITGTQTETCTKIQNDITLDMNCTAWLINHEKSRCTTTDIRQVASCWNTGQPNNCAKSTNDYCGRVETYYSNCK